MTTGLNNGLMKVINILAWILITILVGYGAWLGNKFYDLKESLPQEYVRLERHKTEMADMKEDIKCDFDRVGDQLNKMDNKLDRLIMGRTRSERQSKKDRSSF